jgi:C4-dicarboxylate-specific signal transduction histidine kinase
MAGGIAHEINNPVFVISSRVQLMLLKLEKGTELEKAWKPHLEVILSTCERIARIIRGLRVMARGAEGETTEPISLRALVDQTVDLCEARLAQTGAKLDFHPIDESCIVEGRPVQLSQVVLNLLNNAFDAVEGSEKPWIRIEAKCLGDEVEIAVSDSGPGIDPSIRTRIMEPFFTTKPVGKGTGLGLSLSQGIMKAHHGKLYLDESAPHTRFVVKLPKRQVSK